MNRLTFIRKTAGSVIITSEEPWHHDKDHWIAEFDMSTIPPTLVNDGGVLNEWPHVIDRDHVKELPSHVPVIYTDTHGNICAASGEIIMKGPEK